MKEKVFPWLGLLLILVLLFVLAVITSDKKPSSREILNEVREEIGVQGILEYALEYWTEHEIIEYLFDR